MARKVILAVAGAGKTYHICHELNPNKRNLILAFTHENINNIRKELYNAHGCIPERTEVSTFDSFVYHQFILPYEPTIATHFKRPHFISRGICTVDPPPRTIPNRQGVHVPNPLYHVKADILHYITEKGQYYCATLSELVLQVGKKQDALVKRGAERLNLFYDCIWIDEFQDFREYDYELITTLAKQVNNIVLVGDYFQHSVSATNNTGKPFKKKNRDVSYDEFITELRSYKFEVDLTSLVMSRRCSAEVCGYVSRKLNINIASCGQNEGSVVWVDERATEILEDGNITKLVFNDSRKYIFQAMNWSYSKGDTVDAACVILTDDFEEMDNDKFSAKGIRNSTRNKLYVAMTRTRGNLYLMKASTFKSIKDLYSK